MEIAIHYGEPPLHFFARVRAFLRRYEAETGKEAAVRFDWKRLMDMDWPPRHIWVEEAPDSGTRAEYLIRYARSVGVSAWDDLLSGQLRCQLTKDVAHEATITWPGKRREP